VSGDGILVGGEPTALLAASSAMYEVATRTDDVGLRLAGALAPAASTVMAATPYAPLRAAAVYRALTAVMAGPKAGLAVVGAAFQAVSLELRITAQALEAAGAVGLLASGGLGLLRGERPTILSATDGIDLRRETIGASTWAGPIGHNSSLAVREVRRPDGTTFFVVELTTSPKVASSLGIQVNGVGGYVESAKGVETTLRWAVATRRDAELMLATASASLVPVAGATLIPLPRPTEVVTAVTSSATVVGSIGMIPGTTASGTAVVRTEVTTLPSGGQRLAASLSGGAQLGLLGVVGTGAAGSLKFAVERNPAGAITRASLSTTTEVDRGRHGNALIESGNREATLVERRWDVEMTPERRAAAERVATSVASGEVPSEADVETLAGPVRDADAEEHTYDVRHQQASVDIAVGDVGGGGGGGIDTAVLRQPPPPPPVAAPGGK